MERVEDDIMKQPPRKSKGSLFAGQTGWNIIIQGICQTILTMTSFVIGYYVIGDSAVAITMVFITLSAIQLLHAYNCRSQTHSLFTTNPLKNKSMNFAALAGVILTSIIFIPALRSIFGNCALSVGQLLIAVGLAALIIPLVEIQKFIMLKIKNHKKR
jgi:Ca2+-transporting ATPase